jgi:hypothetical protein
VFQGFTQPEPNTEVGTKQMPVLMLFIQFWQMMNYPAPAMTATFAVAKYCSLSPSIPDQQQQQLM